MWWNNDPNEGNIENINEEARAIQEFNNHRRILRQEIQRIRNQREINEINSNEADRDRIFQSYINEMIYLDMEDEPIYYGTYSGLPIHYAVYYKYDDLVKRLGFDFILEKDSANGTPLYYAVMNNDYLLVKAMIESLQGHTEWHGRDVRRSICDLLHRIKEDEHVEKGIVKLLEKECGKRTAADRLILAAIRSKGKIGKYEMARAKASRKKNNINVGNSMRKLFENNGSTGGKRKTRKRRAL
jgi:hypothetical protein